MLLMAANAVKTSLLLVRLVRLTCIGLKVDSACLYPRGEQPEVLHGSVQTFSFRAP